MLDNKLLVKMDRFIQAMPPLPVSVTKIMELTQDPNVDAKKLNDVISLDPVLTGKILKLINSAYYSMPNKVTTIVRAIIMLGINTVKNLVLSAGVVSAVRGKKIFDALDMEQFWRHSICVGSMARSFALKLKIPPKQAEEYFVAGLLHDIGKIPFNAVIPDDYLYAVEYAKEKETSLYRTEQKMFGLDHTQLGEKIALLWKVNDNLKNTICNHHSLEEVPEESQKFVAIIDLADSIAVTGNMGYSGNVFPTENEERIFEITGLSLKDVAKAEEMAESTLQKAEMFLKII